MSVALTSDATRAVIGVPYDNGTVGSVHVFVREDDTWTEEATLVADDAQSDDYFGWAVAISGDGTRILVGVPYDDVAGANAGSARVFGHRSLRFWSGVAEGGEDVEYSVEPE